jgi:predicted nucleic acid-binding protein
MIYLVDTGPLVAAFRHIENKDPFTPWAVNLLRFLPYPLFTCDAVLTEAGHFLRSSAKLLEAVKRGLLVSRFDTQAAAPRLAQLVEKYADRPMDFADACLVCMSEQTRDCKVVTIDRADFTVYRRHALEPIPLLLPE